VCICGFILLIFDLLIFFLLPERCL
jgi:hypothetical protein